MRRICRQAALHPAILSGRCTAQYRFFFWKKSGQDQANSKSSKESAEEPERIPAHLQRYLSAQTAIDDAFVESSLELLRLISEMDLTEREYDTLTEVSTMLFGASGQTFSLGEQFDTLFVALTLPASRNCSELSRVLLVVVDSVMPTPVAELLREGQGIVCGITEESCRALFVDFIHAMLGEEVAVEISNPLFPVSDDVADKCSAVSVLLRQVVVAVPGLDGLASFATLKQDAENIALRARLFALISQLCKAFDTEGTGLIQVSDLTDSLRNILASEGEVDELLQGVTPDEHGRIRYHQLCLMLTKPRRPASTKTT